MLLLLRPAYDGMGDPYRPELYRWALAALTAAIIFGWYALLRRWIGAAAMAIGALAWPALFGVVTAWLAPGLSYYGSLPVAAAACGWLVAITIDERWAVWRVVALTAGAAPGVLILIVGATGILTVMGIPMGAARVFFLVLAGLLTLPLVELTMPAYPTGAPGPAHRRRTVRRWAMQRWAIMLALTIMLLAGLSGAGLAVDRFDEDRPAPAHLMYVLNAGSGTALWASEDDAPHEWTARYLADRGAQTKIPLPYRTEPKWSGSAQAVPLEAPELTVLGSRTNGDVTVLELGLISPRGADVLTLHADRPVQNATIAVADHAPVTSTPSYAEDAEDEQWPYELRFYDPPLEGVRVTLRFAGGRPLRVGLSDYTVGLEEIPGFTERPPRGGQIDFSQFGPPHRRPYARTRWPQLRTAIRPRKLDAHRNLTEGEVIMADDTNNAQAPRRHPSRTPTSRVWTGWSAPGRCPGARKEGLPSSGWRAASS